MYSTLYGTRGQNYIANFGENLAEKRLTSNQNVKEHLNTNFLDPILFGPTKDIEIQQAMYSSKILITKVITISQ